MAGGIGLPFQFNIKCLLVVGAIMMAYYALPEDNPNIYYYYIPITLILSLVLYVYLYNCRRVWIDKNLWLLGFLTIGLTALFQYLYWNLPRNLWMVYYLIFFIGYIALAYFDYIMNCDIPLQSGLISFTHLFKVARDHPQN